MADDLPGDDEEGVGAGRDMGRGPNPASLAMSSASCEQADRYLDAQMKLLRLQTEHLHEQRELQLSHLKWRRFNDQLNGALRIVFILLGVVVLVGVAALVWDASHAEGLVVDAFSAPPDFAAHGIGGDVLAGDLTARLRAVRGIANANALSSTSDVSKSSEGEMRIEIPETGISYSEVWRFLRAWLGHEQHVSGSLRELSDGQLTLSAQLGANQPVEVTGKPGELHAMEQKLAEGIFAQFDPINAVLYLWAVKRNDEAGRRAFDDTRLALPDPARADAYVLWGEQALYQEGNSVAAMEREKIALAIDPHLAVAHMDLAEAQSTLGRDEAALAEAHATLAQHESDQPADLQGVGFRMTLEVADRTVAVLIGGYAEAERARCGASCVPELLDVAALYAALRHDTRSSRGLLMQSRAAGYVEPWYSNVATYHIATARGDWEAAQLSLRDAVRAYQGSHDFDSGMSPALYEATYVRPLLAEDLAHAGAFARAEAVIATTPRDCYLCLRMRGNIRAIERKWDAANYWFAAAVAQGSSIPFAYADWGAMLLAKGDADAAIAKFKTANAKGPHFADPLEMWGEALMQESRSDLAIAKFEEADKYAPRWGRLHLKWGEALFYAGKRDEAKKQIAMASHLDLSQSDKTALTKWTSTHG
jgi:tetratricopeptide (TPR) repeat protein